MRKEEFEAWHQAGHSGLKPLAFRQYCISIGNVEKALGKSIDDFPIDKSGQCLDRIYQGQHFPDASQHDLINYRSAVRKYWVFRKWILKNPL